jgi:hypothetical protein
VAEQTPTIIVDKKRFEASEPGNVGPHLLYIKIKKRGAKWVG